MKKFNKKKIRIGYLIPEFPGQTHTFFWREAQELKKKGFDIYFFSTKKPSDSIISHDWSKKAIKETEYLLPIKLKFFMSTFNLLKSGIFIWFRIIKRILHSNELKINSIKCLFAGSQIAYIANNKKINHIHAHSCGNCANIVMFANLISGIPYSITLHGPHLSTYKGNQIQKWKKAKFGIVVARYLLDEVKQEVGGSISKKIEIAPMGVDISKFKRLKKYKPWNKKKYLKIFSCGRLNHGKGHHDVIKAVSILNKKGIDAKLNIAGEDASEPKRYRKELEKLIKKLSLENNVKLLGAISEKEVIKKLEKAHVFVLASYNEALGVATMEAMAMGVPVAVSDVGGVSDLVTNNKDGILFKPKKPKKITNAISKIIKNKKLAKRLSKNSRKKIKKSFNSKISAEVIARNLKNRKW